MIYSEIYGAYYEAVHRILNIAKERPITKKDIYSISAEYAFQDSGWTISDKLLQGDWALLGEDKKTPLKDLPDARPATVLEKRWLKSLLLDPRIALFDVEVSDLEDVEPLFRPDMFIYFDRRLDGDRYADPEYTANFRNIRKAIENQNKISFLYLTQTGRSIKAVCVPIKIEYSPKTDKFQLISVWKSGDAANFNISDISDLEILEPIESVAEPVFHMNEVVLELEDRNDALNRSMIQFSDLEKETTKLDHNRYQIHIKYRREEESELLIRILEFGQHIKVVSPDSIKREIADRIRKQFALMENIQ